MGLNPSGRDRSFNQEAISEHSHGRITGHAGVGTLGQSILLVADRQGIVCIHQNY